MYVYTQLKLLNEPFMEKGLLLLGIRPIRVLSGEVDPKLLIIFNSKMISHITNLGASKDPMMSSRSYNPFN